MGPECLGDFLQQVLCCLKVGLKVLWEPGGEGQGTVLGAAGHTQAWSCSAGSLARQRLGHRVVLLRRRLLGVESGCVWPEGREGGEGSGPWAGVRSRVGGPSRLAQP